MARELWGGVRLCNGRLEVSMRLLVLAGLSCVLCVPALAQDEETFQDLLDDEDDSFQDFRNEPEPAAEDPETPAEPKPVPAPEPELDFEDDPEEPDTDLLGEDPESTDSVGGDTAETYRATLARTEGMDVDDEMLVWERYLQTYPQSAFRGQIEARVAVLEDALYDDARPGRQDPPDQLDAQDQQMAFSQALLLESINPRRRVHLLLEWGLPDWANLAAGYEHPFGKKFSVLGQFRRRFTGPSLEAGVRYALVKSQRTRTLVTVLMDVHMNLAPAFIGFRPQLAVGKAFGPLEIQAQGGVDIMPRKELDIRGIGGLSLNYRAAEPIAVFAETSVLIKNKSGAAGPFRFNQIAFGMRFYPMRKAKKPDNVEVNLGAAIPYSSAYWRYHFGAVVGQANIYLD